MQQPLGHCQQIVTSAPSTAYAVPLPRCGRGGWGFAIPLRGCCYFSFPRQCGGSAERSEAIGALVANAVFSRQTAFIIHGAPTTASRSPSPAEQVEPVKDVAVKFL